LRLWKKFIPGVTPPSSRVIAKVLGQPTSTPRREPTPALVATNTTSSTAAIAPHRRQQANLQIGPTGP